MKRKTHVILVALMLSVMMIATACASNNDTPASTQGGAAPEATPQYMSKEDLKAAVEAGGNGYIILDVRKAADFAELHINGSYSGDVDPSINGAGDDASVANLKAAIQRATGSETGNADSKFVLVCYAGKKYAAAATRLMEGMGIASANIYTLTDGFNSWKDAGADYVALTQSGAEGVDPANEGTANTASNEKLLSADALEKLMAEKQIKIFDLRSAEDFEKGHIPGAINIRNKEFEDPDNAVDGEIATVPQFEKLMSGYGISSDDLIVVYANASSPQMAPRLIWTLEVYGHTNTYLLNGHYQHWEKEGKQIETGPNKEFAPAQYKVKGVDNSINVAKDAVINKAAGTVVLDVRPANEYIGEKVAEGNARGGHIPGSVNVFYMDTVNEDGFFYDEAYLTKLYQDAGVTADKEIIVYCQRGHRASHTWFVLSHLLGFENVKVYDGSMMEWSNLPDLAIATGADGAGNAEGGNCE